MLALLLAGVICLISISFAVWMYGLNLRKIRKNPPRKPLEYNPAVVQAFNEWLLSNIGMHLTEYVEGKTGLTRSKLKELTLDSKFTSDCVEKVSQSVTSNMPVYYEVYMTQFHGRDRFANVIYRMTKRVVTQWVTKQLADRRDEFQ
jgi:hypothetical protein